MLKYMVDNPDGNINRTEIAKICLDILSLSNYRTKSTLDALMHEELKDARAWMNAALSYQHNCWGGLKSVNNTKVVVDTMSFLMSLTQHSSNALSMIEAYANYGKDIAFWAPPKTERSGFYEKGSGGNSELGFKGGVPSNLKQVVTVCKNQRKCYRTVQEAVNHAPDYTTPEAPYVIKIWKGVYEETVRIPFEKKYVVLLGEGMRKTIITGSLNAGLGINTYNTATLGVLGDGFMAKGLTIENTAGADFNQAVAFRSDSDRSMIEDCEIIGNQDTLYAHSLRQFYKKCRIQGNVDFIFGNAAAVFQDCEILFQAQHPNPEGIQTNTITAHARCDPAQSTGLVFLNCVISGTEEYLGYYRKNPLAHTNYLGRPWKEYSRTVFINCNIGELICPDGWMPWNGDVGLKTVFCGEFGNSGLGSDVSKRVPWSNQIPPRHIHTYSVQNFIQVDQWIPKSHNPV